MASGLLGILTQGVTATSGLDDKMNQQMHKYGNCGPELTELTAAAVQPQEAKLMAGSGGECTHRDI